MTASSVSTQAVNEKSTNSQPIKPNLTKRKSTKKYSIKRYLSFYIIGWCMAMTIIPGIWVYHDTAHEVEELFDASLAQSARVLHALLNRKTVTAKNNDMVEALLLKSQQLHEPKHNYEKKVSFQVIDDSGLLLRSASAPSYPESDKKTGYHYITVDGFEWRIFTLFSAEDNWWLVIGERTDIRNELIHNIALDHAIPLFLLTPLFVFIVGFVIKRGLKPLDIIANDVKNKAHDNLDVLTYSQEPEEVSGLIEAINQLFTTLNQQYEKERRFSADAAHELRTPLAALLIHTENILEDNQDPQLDSNIIKLKRGIHRLSQLISQLLSLSRTEQKVLSKDFSTLNINAALQAAINDCQTLAQQKEQQLIIELATDELRLKGNQALLHTMFFNVISNAIKFSPKDSDITISMNEKHIEIADQGKGIDSHLLERVKDRFYRTPSNKAEGSGLGLAIVDKIAEIHQIPWQIVQNSPQGLIVRFDLTEKEEKEEN